MIAKGALHILAGAALAVAPSIAAAQEQEPLTIGGVGSFSGGGASIGNVARIGWQLAVDEINEAGGIDGRPVRLVLGDSQTDPTHGVSEVRRLIGVEGIKALVGPITSQETMPIVPISTQANIAQFTTAASPDLTPQFAPYLFSNSPTGLNQMIPAIDYAINTLGAQKIAVISDNGGMSKGAVSEMVKYMEEKGVPPVIVQEFAFRAEDMTPQIFSLRNSGAEAVLLINSTGDDARKVLQNIDEIGWDVPVLGNLTTSNYALGNAKILGDEAFDNVYSVQFVGMTFCPGDPVGENPFAQFSARAEAVVPDLEKLGGSAALAPYYIEPFVLKAAIEGAGSTDGKAVAEWIVANPASLPDLLGELHADETSHFLATDKSMAVVKAPHIHREDGLVERAVCD